MDNHDSMTKDGYVSNVKAGDFSFVSMGFWLPLKLVRVFERKHTAVLVDTILAAAREELNSL